MRTGEINVKEAAKLAGVTEQTIYQWIRLRKLEGLHRKHFSKIFINKGKFEKWICDNTK